MGLLLLLRSHLEQQPLPQLLARSATLHARHTHTQEGMQLAITPMVAWFQRELRGIDSSTINPNKQLRAPGSFKRWVCSQVRQAC